MSITVFGSMREDDLTSFRDHARRKKTSEYLFEGAAEIFIVLNRGGGGGGNDAMGEITPGVCKGTAPVKSEMASDE